MEWRKAGAAEQGRAIMAGLLDPVEQVEAYLDAAIAHPHQDRIYARLTPDRARAEAIAAHDRARQQMRRGLLDGVAITWKDNIDSANIATEAGSQLLKGRIPDHDAAILHHATDAGLVCLGKTHMTELAFSGLGVNPMTATPPNAINPDLAPGGSSSGAAVSVALGLAAAAIGTDTGGSIRGPAAWNDLVGFKPSPGAVPMKGIVPLAPNFDMAGPLARNVEDCALLWAAMIAGPTPDLREAAADGLRLLVLDGVPYEGADAEPITAFGDAVARLAAQGAVITHACPPSAAEALALSPQLFAPEAYGHWRDHIEAAPELMYDRILTRFRGGKDVSGPDFVAAWVRLVHLRRDWTQAVAGYDGVILPTVPILPPPIKKLLEDEPFFTQKNLMTLRNTRIANVLGLPAVTLPTGHPGCGITVMGRAGADRHMLRVAAAMEAGLS